MKRTLYALALLATLVLFALVQPVLSQKSANGQAATPVTASAATPIDNSKGATTQPPAPTTAHYSSVDPNGDSVPCEFSKQELLGLSASQDAYTFTDTQNDQLKVKIIEVLQSKAGTSSLQKALVNLFDQRITEEYFTGLTQTETLNRILSYFSEVTGGRPACIKQNDDETIKSAKDNVWTGINYLIGQQTDLHKYLFSAQDNSAPLDRCDDYLQKLRDNPSQNKLTTDILNDVASVSQLQSTIADAAREVTTGLLRPKDIACSMEILTHDETRSSFGTLVAKNYIAAQVTVRNLNQSYEFQIHDAEFSVDADPTGRHQRFFSGSDHRIVRSFAVAQQSFDARNLTINSAQQGGALLSAISPIFGGSFANAVGVLSGGAIPGLGKVWKDRTTDQLNLLNDMALAQGNGGTTVPRHGVTVFVMFVPSKSFEGGWWTLPCIDTSYIATLKGGKIQTLATFGRWTGVNIDRVLEPCLSLNSQTIIEDKSSKAAPDSKLQFESGKDGDIFAYHKPVAYRNWSGNSLSIFRELAHVTVSGVHTVETSELAASASKMTCQPSYDSKGNVVFDGTDPIICTVSGQNLQTITDLRLRNADNQAEFLDTALAPVSGDPSTATVKFDAAKLAALQGTTYSALIVDNKSTETKTPIAMHFITTLNPVKITPETLDVDTDGTATIAGSHLDTATSIKLARNDKSTKTVVTITALKKAADKLSFTLTKAQASTLDDPILKDLSSGAKIDVTVSSKAVTATLKEASSASKSTTAPTKEANVTTTPGVDSAPLTITVKMSPESEKPIPATPATPKPKNQKAPAAKGTGTTKKPDASTPVPKQ